MLEVTNIRNGAILNHARGTETDDYLEIKVEGIADPQAIVKVNGADVERADRFFSAPVRLTQKINEIVVSADSSFGEQQLRLTVLWDKKSFKRYNYYIDDCSFFYTDIAKQRPKSLFDHFFLKRLKEIHDRYGTKITLNSFYRNDHFPFELKDFPDVYKQEWIANSDWLRLSFHAYSEFPDRPYQRTAPEKLAEDFDLLLKRAGKKEGRSLDGSVMSICHEGEVIRLLELLMRDSGGEISYFVYELDFGRRYEPGMVTDGEGEVDLSCSQALYRDLVRTYF